MNMNYKISISNEIITLTRMESLIIEELLNGYSYKEISYKTYISINTVRSHVKNIYRKLQVQKATELFKVLLLNKLIVIDQGVLELNISIDN